jgi:2-polyprenyl-3-methyl-5-hydroxy-6-metoxy-1,4-benzoquinol methylase
MMTRIGLLSVKRRSGAQFNFNLMPGFARVDRSGMSLTAAPAPTPARPTHYSTFDLPSAIVGSQQADFHSDRYLRHTARRLEHLASLGLDLHNRTVLEVGAGIGDLTTFFLDRGCTVHATEGRPENYEILRQRFADTPRCTTALLDLDPPPPSSAARSSANRYDILACYGLLYHLSNPAAALDYFAAHRPGMLLLETIILPHGEPSDNPWREDAALAGAAVSGTGSRPNRAWLWRQLRARFKHVFMPRTQPNHIEFPIDWTLEHHPAAARSIFIASDTPIENPQLSPELLMHQVRH